MGFYGNIDFSNNTNQEIIEETTFEKSGKEEFSNTVEHMVKYAATRYSAYFQDSRWPGSIRSHRNTLIELLYSRRSSGNDMNAFISYTKDENLYSKIIKRIREDYDYIKLDNFENFPVAWGGTNILNANWIITFISENAASDYAKEYAAKLVVISCKEYYKLENKKKEKYVLSLE